MAVPDPSSVNVPRELVEALREALDQIPAAPVEREGLYPTLYWAARALVDAAERPVGKLAPFDLDRLDAPVGEPLCRCGHPENGHKYAVMLGYCGCQVFDPAPVPVTAEAEAEEAWMKWADERAAPNTVYIRHRDGTPFHAGFLAGFRAARLAGGPTLAAAWDEGYTNGYRLAESYLTRPDGTHVLPTNPYRTPESEDTE